MSGIAFKISGVDFSNSPLGKVTESVSVDEIVTSYLNEVGGDEAMKSKLVTLLTMLDNADVLDKIDIFPMLGSSIDKKIIGIKGNVFEELAVGANAVAHAEGIEFTDTSLGSLDVETYDNTFNGVYTFQNVKSSNYGRLVSYGSDETSGSFINAFIGNLPIIQTAEHQNSSGASPQISTRENFVSHSGYCTASAMLSITEGQQTYSDTCTFLNKTVHVNNVIGGNYADGTPTPCIVRMFAVGIIPENKMLSVDAAFRAYFA